MLAQDPLSLHAAVAFEATDPEATWFAGVGLLALTKPVNSALAYAMQL
jgi:hypothetical protein